MFSAARSPSPRSSRPRGCRSAAARRLRIAVSIGISISSTPRFAAIARASACVSSLEWGEGMTTQVDALGAERVDGDQRDQRRVDAAGERQHDALEAVLLDVVAQAEPERRVDLGDRLERLGDRALARARHRAGRTRRWRGPGPRGRPGRDRAPRATGGLGAGELEVADEQLLVELAAPGRASRRSALTITLWPSKTSSSWPPTGVAERERGARLAGALGDHLLALGALAAVIGRGGRVDDQARARQRLGARGRARKPDVLADRQPDQRAVELDQRRARRRARSSGARRRRRSWAAASCGRCRGSRRRRAPRASCR